MRGGVLLIIFAIILAYLGVSGKYKCFTYFMKCLVNGEACNCAGESGTVTPTGGSPNATYDATDKVSIRLPQLPKLPTTPIIYG